MGYTVTSFILCCLLTTITTSFCYALTLEEKVGQLLMVHFRGESGNDEAKALIQDIGVGGIIYYTWANGLTSQVQVQRLSSDLQALAHNSSSHLPLLIATDQEGGRVTRLTHGFIQFPSNREMASHQNPDLIEDAAYRMGSEMKAVGINMNLAPVVDVDSNPNNPVIGNRAFSNNPQEVTRFGGCALRGYEKAGIFATLKHFPGHGDTTKDSHSDLPCIDKPLDVLENTELYPFRALAQQADAIMTAHLLVPAFDDMHCSTISKPTIDYLRNILRFDGIVITDSLAMGAILQQCGTAEDAAIAALQAGCDILLLGGRQLSKEAHSIELQPDDIRRIHQAIISEVHAGRIAESRIDESLARIMRLKDRIFYSH